MTRPVRIQDPGSVFYVTARASGHMFRDEMDRRWLLRLVAGAVERFAWIVTAFVVMPDHFRLLIELTRPNLSCGMNWLDGCYAQRFNRRHDRAGRLCEGRFRAVLIQKEAFLVEVARDMFLEPVRAELVSRPEDYDWSSFRHSIGDAIAPTWLATRELLAAFGNDPALARNRFRRFVQDQTDDGSGLWKNLVARIYLGDPVWIRAVRERVHAQPDCMEYTRDQYEVVRPRMADVVRSVAAGFDMDARAMCSFHGGDPRMLAAWIGNREAKLRLGEIAAGLRLRNRGHVSSLIRRCEDQLSRDAGLRSRRDAIVRELHSM